VNLIKTGDAKQVLDQWAMEGVEVQTCITSPPYYNARDYNVDGQIGLEETPYAYVDKIVDVMRSVRNVLAKDGTVWLNIGDSYGSGGSGQNFDPATKSTANGTGPSGAFGHVKRPPVQGFFKQLLGIPWRVALALHQDGWYLRSDIIWNKPNAMPEPVKDRPVKSHEYIFLLTKSPYYYYDYEAIKETAFTDPKRTTPVKKGLKTVEEASKRNKRSVWSIPTGNYKGAHFAVFPEALVETCILAGSREGDIVLDPFMGSGTTAAVAKRLGRRYLGCDLNPEYEKLQQERLGGVK
jgi:DNA modification methylase